MTEDLSRTLTEAAAEAARRERVRSLKETGKSSTDAAQAAEVVAAVLETLAADVEAKNQPSELVDYTSNGKHYREGKSYVVGLMRRLAADARTES